MSTRLHGIIRPNQVKLGLHIITLILLARAGLYAQGRASTITLRVDGCPSETVASSYKFEAQGGVSTKAIDSQFSTRLPNLTIVKPVESCSAKFFEYFNRGFSIPEMTVTQSVDGKPILSFSIYGAFVANDQLTMDPLTQSAQEVVTFSPRTILIYYLQAGTKAGWDYATGAPY